MSHHHHISHRDSSYGYYHHDHMIHHSSGHHSSRVGSHSPHHHATSTDHSSTPVASTSSAHDSQPAVIVEINNPVFYIGGAQASAGNQTYNSSGAYNNAPSANVAGQDTSSSECDTLSFHHKPFFSQYEIGEINKAYVDSMIGDMLL